MWNLLTVALLIAAVPEVELQTVEGEVLTGTLVAWSAEGVRLKTEAGERALTVDQLSSIATRQPVAIDSADGKIELRLIDGSALVASQYSVREGQARIVLLGGRSLTASTQVLASVRFQSVGGGQGKQWEQILKDPPPADLLVVERGDAIDYHKGVIRDVSDSEVRFELEGEALPVKRSKVAGLVYYHPPGRKLPDAVCRIVDAAGARWTVRELRLEGDLCWTTAAGVECRRPLDEIKRIEFASDKVFYLSDMKPESTSWLPFFPPDKEQDFLARYYAPRQDRTSDGRTLRLGGKAYRKGLSLHTRTTVVYRLPERYRRFKATVGIDDEVRPRGSIRLVIRGDDRVLLETEINGTEPPQSVDLDITGVKRLTVMADYGKDLDQGDRLLLCEARVIK